MGGLFGSSYGIPLDPRDLRPIEQSKPHLVPIEQFKPHLVFKDGQWIVVGLVHNERYWKAREYAEHKNNG